MNRKKTHEEFIKEVYGLVENEYSVLGEYINANTKILMRHNCCGYEWNITPSKFLLGRRCAKCFGTHKRTTQEFKDEVFNIVGNEYDVLSEYENRNKHILMRHKKCMQTWKITPTNFLEGWRCPVCSNHKIVKGINDMWTTNPEVAKLLANPEDGYKYTYGSAKKTDWKCPVCGEIIKNKQIASVNRQGLPCPICSDGISYPEKVMYNLLKQLNVNFEYQKRFDWCEYKINGKQKYGIYDFYIPDKNLLIEMDGHFHTINAKYSKLSEKEIKDIDIMKSNLANKNNINIIRIKCDYLKPDCKFEYIKNNIINNLSSIFDLFLINWEDIDMHSQNSFLIDVCKLWSTKMFKVIDIAKELKLDKHTIKKYLKIGNKLNICNYDANEEKMKIYNRNKKPINVYKNDTYIETFESIVDLHKKSKLYFNVVLYPRGIVDTCNNKRKDYHGFVFKFVS